MGFRIATAPVSYGVYGGTDGPPWDADALLSAMAASGYVGTELGPPGALGAPEDLRRLLDHHGLDLVGGYIPLHCSKPERWEEDFRLMRITLEELAYAGGTGTLAILADAGDDALLANPARPWGDRSASLDDERWDRLRECTRRAMELAWAFQLTPSFHPHISTYVESPWEVERLLALTDVELTLDTGHLFLAGASAARCLRDWRHRVNHVHVKDVRVEVLRRNRAARRTDFDAWWSEVSCPLGEGDVDLEAFLAELGEVDYRGWLVVEQDRGPTPIGQYPAVAEEQAGNLAWLEARLEMPDSDRPRPSAWSC